MLKAVSDDLPNVTIYNNENLLQSTTLLAIDAYITIDN